MKTEDRRRIGRLAALRERRLNSDSMLILLQDQVRADEARPITVNVSWRVKVIVHLMPGVPYYHVLVEYGFVVQHWVDVRIGAAARLS